MTGKTVLITGASSGIGLETALLLAEQGMRVFASMRNLERGQQLRAEAQRRQMQVTLLQLDVTDPASIDAAFARLMREAGQLDGLVSNAGMQVRGYFEDLSDAEIRQVFDVNLFGAMAVCRAALQQMRPRRSGRIVLVSSIGGRVGAPALSAYAGAKHALEGFGEALHLEVAGFGVGVSIVEPAIVRTEIWGHNRNLARRALAQNSPYRHWFQRLERMTDELVADAPTTSADVAQAIHQALTAPRPPLRRVVGRRAGLLLALRKLLPDGLFERLYFGEIIRRATGERPAF